MVSLSVLPPTQSARAVRRVSLSTIGCKVNRFETELLAQKLGQRQYVRVGPLDMADLYVINTCTVTAEADRQVRKQVRKVIRVNPKAWVIVTGCYAQIDPKACADIPGVDLVVGNSWKQDIPYLLDQFYQNKLPPIVGTDIDRHVSLPDQLLSGYKGRSRAFVQIQQGCDQGCTFCVIHIARGPNRSFSPMMIERQIERLVLNGYREIVLCGVDIGSYGEDMVNQSNNLVRLLEELVRIDGDFRLRLSSIDPAHLNDELIRLIANEPAICPQLHLSIQSGCTLILKRMKRRATRELLYERVQTLRKAVPELVLSADILVGFPTESEEHFNQTLNAISDLEIAYPHVFVYSQRPGTPASRIPSQVPNYVRKRRAVTARKAGKEIWSKVARRQLGSRQRVVLESNKRGNNDYQIARAANYFPVKLMSGACLVGDWADVEIIGFEANALIARQLT